MPLKSKNSSIKKWIFQKNYPLLSEKVIIGSNFADKFIKDSKQAKIIASKGNPEGIRDFLKKIGSNFRIADRTLACDFKNAFKIAEKYHAEALCAEATSYDFTKSENWRRGWDSNPRILK